MDSRQYPAGVLTGLLTWDGCGLGQPVLTSDQHAVKFFCFSSPAERAVCDCTIRAVRGELSPRVCAPGTSQGTEAPLPLCGVPRIREGDEKGLLTPQYAEALDSSNS